MLLSFSECFFISIFSRPLLRIFVVIGEIPKIEQMSFCFLLNLLSLKRRKILFDLEA